MSTEEASDCSNGLLPPITVAAESLSEAEQRLVAAEVAELEAALRHTKTAREIFERKGLHVFANITERAETTLRSLVDLSRSHSVTGGNSALSE